MTSASTSAADALAPGGTEVVGTKMQTPATRQTPTVNLGRRGGRPNVTWLSVPEDDLRAHPQFIPLPPPRCVAGLQSWRTVADFRQDSWQWGALHAGRLTTSRAAGALGILEPRAAAFLGVPRGLRGSYKARHALRHLSEQSAFPLDDLEAAAACLVVPCHANSDGDAGGQQEERGDKLRRQSWRAQWERDLQTRCNKCWRAWGGDTSWRATAWAHAYKAWCGRKNTGRRRSVGGSSGGSGGHVQMMWGTIHEPTAVLCALNFFHDQGVRVAECGMFPGESLQTGDAEQLTLVRALMEAGVPIGASPDGLLHFPDGTVEVLEVKNHSPFRTMYRGGGGSGRGGTVVQDRDPPEELPPWYVPQVQLEMLCVGPHCRSAVFVRLTATRGASLVRIERDDAYILAMLRRFLRFAMRFLHNGEELTPNFADNDDDDGYASAGPLHAFLEHTLAVSASAIPLGHVGHDSVQRKRPATVPLLV